MREQPTVIWQATNAPNALSTYEAYKTIDDIASLHPARVLISDADRRDRDQLFRYAQRRHLSPALRMPSYVDRDEVRRMHQAGVNRMIFRVDSASRDEHDAIHGPGSFRMTLRAMRLAADEHVPMEVETRVTRKTAGELSKIAEIITAFHATEWLVTFPVPPLPAGEEMINAAEAEHALEVLAAVEARCNLRVRTIEAPHFIRFGGSAIREVVFIGSNGEVRAGESSSVVSGDVRYRPLHAMMTSDSFLAMIDSTNLRGKCGRCEFRGECGGSRARAFAMTGDVFAPDPLCAYQPSAS